MAIIRTRVLAETSSQVWIAVSGALVTATRHPLHQRLRSHADQGHSAFFLDLRELECGDGITAEEVREVFALGPRVRFHLIGAPALIRRGLAGDTRASLHSGVISAWEAWA